jgi:MFS family permease
MVMSRLGFFAHAEALQNREFRIYCIGQAISLFGGGMQSVALAWLTWRMLHSPMALAALAAASSSTLFLFSYAGGHLADKLDRRRSLIVLEVLSVAQAFALAAMQFWHAFSLPLVLTLAAIGGVLTALEFSSRQTFTSDLVGRGNLVSGRAIYMAIYSSTLALGAAAASLMTWLWAPNGEMYCFVANGISYLFSLYAFSQIRSVPVEPAQTGSIGECIKFAFKNRLVFSTFAQTTVLVFFGIRLFPLLPMFADKVLHSGAFGHGMLRVAWAVGSVLGSLAIAKSRTQTGLLRWATGALLALPVVTALFGVSQRLVPSMLLLLFVAYLIYAHVTSCQSLLQLESTPQLQGRLLGVRAMLVAIIDFIGAFAAGAAADLWGPQYTAYGCALLGLLFSIPLLISSLRANLSSLAHLPLYATVATILRR